jgi:hypothetical protein
MEIKDNLCYVDSRYSDRPWPMRNDHILTLFGLKPNAAIPSKFSDEKMIGNVKVKIVPRGSITMKRRVVAECPKCQKMVCAGHLMQHMKIHKEK